ncbi:MAG: glycosyltransferase family 9 protein [Flaviaesturariibacter sp.]|nr:glycosyltransferase family 9 protein [Flaviaesturariibacter sp.]
MKILVRLPNWLGDMVMAVGFLDQLRRAYPEAAISVIAKKGIHTLLPFFPPLDHIFVFSKQDNKGAGGAWRFGRSIRKQETFDLFFSLPDSFSAGIMGFATGARRRIGFSKEGRGIFFTKTVRKPAGLHRVDEYVRLLEEGTGMPASTTAVRLTADAPRTNTIIVNINSEASSRRLTVAKAVEMITAVRLETGAEIILVGAPNEKPFIDSVCALLDVDGITNRAGSTALPELATLMASARLVLSTDSGPAHLANALGTPTVVLFGAGDETNTAPYNKANLSIVRLGKLSCEPCRKNTCVRYDIPQCLEQLNSYAIAALINKQLELHGERIL